MAAHPHNRPTLSADGQRVERGYGILQPHVATPLSPPEEATLYHWLFSGQSGIDPYSVASSEVYQDLFHEGTFTGKACSTCTPCMPCSAAGCRKARC